MKRLIVSALLMVAIGVFGFLVMEESSLASREGAPLAMSYQDAVQTQIIPRSTAALQGIANSLVAAGLPANRVTVSMPDTDDLRFQIVAVRGARTLVGYIELTDASHSLGDPGRGKAIFTFWLEADGVELTTSYAPGPIQPYTTDAGIDALLAKLAQLEATVPEAAVKIRAFLGL